MGYDFKILYPLGPNNKAANALSHMLEEAQLNLISVPLLLELSVVEKEIKVDAKLMGIFDCVIQFFMFLS